MKETQLIIDLESIKENIKSLKSLLKDSTLFMAVVKSNAYGHGLVRVAQACIEAGADWLGVANLDEAIVLRENNIFKPILVLGGVAIDDYRSAANKDISMPIFSLAQAKEVAEINFDKTLKVHLKVDTGLNRLGLKLSEIEPAVALLKSHRNIIIEGIYSHLASVEENDLDYARMQLENLKQAVEVLENLGLKNLIKHLSATSAILVLKEAEFDMVRCGIGIYGLWPSEEIKKQFGRQDLLVPSLSYKTEIIQTKEVKKGEKIGYGCSFEAKEDMTIGVIPVGYYEGLDRGLSNCGQVIVGGERCNIIGRVCMNMTIVDISSLISKSEFLISKNKEVVIIGRQGNEEITVDEIAEKLGTINYEVVARLPEHLERRFL